jgi:hypothetical protein
MPLRIDRRFGKAGPTAAAEKGEAIVIMRMPGCAKPEFNLPYGTMAREPYLTLKGQ